MMLRRLLLASAALLLLAPLPTLLALSLAQRWAWPALLPQGWQWQVWQALLHGGGALLAPALLSTLMALVVALAASAAALPTSRAVARHRGRASLLLLAHLPYAISPAVLGVGLFYGFLQLGLAEQALGVIAAQTLLAYAYALIFLTGCWTPQLEALADTARTLGASPWQVWRCALLPPLRPLLRVCLYQTFLMSWFDFPLAQIIGAGAVRTLALALYEYLSAGDLRLAAACAVLLVLPPLLGSWLLQQPLPLSLEHRHG